MNLLLIPRHSRVRLAPIAIRTALIMLSMIAAGCNRAADSGSTPVSDLRVHETVGDARGTSAKPTLESGDPASIRPEELKTLLDGVPDSFRKKRSDLDLARDLGIRAWSIDYSGGPLNCWLDIEETGQKTMEARYPGPQGASFPAQAKQGHIMMGLRPGAARNNPSERSRRILQELGNPVDGIGEVFILSGALYSHEMSADPRIPKLWAAWTEAVFKEISHTEKVEGSEDVTLLAIEATEKQAPAGAQPRKLTFALRAKAVGASKP